MNDNELRVDSEQKNTYHATTNLNTAIENPQINMNSAMGVNIQNIDGINNADFLNNNLNINQDLNGSNFNFNNSSGFVQNMNDQSNYVNNSTEFNQGQFNISNNQMANNQESYMSNSFINSDQTNRQWADNVVSSQTQFVPNTNDIVYNNQDSLVEDVSVTQTEDVKYKPTMNEKNKRGFGSQVSKEFKVMVFIIFILLLFLLVIPYIYDFFSNLQLVITT